MPEPFFYKKKKPTTSIFLKKTNVNIIKLTVRERELDSQRENGSCNAVRRRVRVRQHKNNMSERDKKGLKLLLALYHLVYIPELITFENPSFIKKPNIRSFIKKTDVNIIILKLVL